MQCVIADVWGSEKRRFISRTLDRLPWKICIPGGHALMGVEANAKPPIPGYYQECGADVLACAFTVTNVCTFKLAISGIFQQ